MERVAGTPGSRQRMATTGVRFHRREERLAAECHGVLAGWGTLLAPRAARRQERLRLRRPDGPTTRPFGEQVPHFQETTVVVSFFLLYLH